jgi:DNA-directed RNA polymerase subunit L
MTPQTTVQNVSLTSNKIDLSGTQYAALKHLLPKEVNQILSFEMVNSNCSFVNALRRTIKNEIPVRYLTVSHSDIFTTDPWVDNDTIRKRIEMIPIAQDIPIGTTYAVRYENTSDTYVDILSAEIKQRGAAAKGVNQDAPICSINAGYSFVIDNITVGETYGYTNSRVAIGRVGYEILNHDMVNLSAANSDPTHFRLEMEVPGNIDPKDLVHKAIDSICDRLDAIDYSESKIEYDVYKLAIANESHSLGNLLATYIFEIYPTIDYVMMREPHPSKRECVIDIRHPQAEKLCKQAVEMLKKEYQALHKAFK